MIIPKSHPTLPYLNIAWIGENDSKQSDEFQANYNADDHQFYAVGSTLADVHDELAVCAESASSWYRANFAGKFGQVSDNQILSRRKESLNRILIDNHEVRFTESLKLLGACIDNNFRFDEHISRYLWEEQPEGRRFHEVYETCANWACLQYPTVIM